MRERAPGDGLDQREWGAIILLLLGGFIFVVGWFAGVMLLWNSPAWTTRDKWYGTLVVPGGLATGIFFGLFAVTAGGLSSVLHYLGILAFAVLVGLAIGTSVYLARRASGAISKQPR